MSKTFLYRLFGLGKLPTAIEERIDEEGLLFADEGIPIILIYKNFKAPGRSFKYKIIKCTGSICLTKKKIYASIYRKIAVGLDWNDPKISAIKFSIEKDMLCMKFESSIFDNKTEGSVEYKFKCHDPEIVFKQINKIKK